MNKRQIVAGTVAAVLTLGAAAAAVVVNLGAASPQDTSPAGKLAATEVVTAPPSTIYVDVTVPDLPPGSVPRADATSGSSATAVGHDEDSSTDDEHAERVQGRTDDD
jgi:hypothetical protein